MTSSEAASPYAAVVTTDAELGTTIIALSYTDPHDPAHNLLACIAPGLGSNWYRLRAGQCELIHYEPEDLKQRGHTGAFVLWPFPNRVRDRQYTYHGEQYSFASIKRVQGILIHGLVFDRSWSYTRPVADQQGASVTTTVEMDPASPYYETYPFASRLSLTYTLTRSGMTVAYSVQNTGKQSLPYGFGLHPYFTLPSGREQTLVTLSAAQVMEADATLLPTGRLLDVHTAMYAMFDLNQPVPVGHLKLDHVYTGLPASREALIEHRDLHLRVRITASEDFTHAVIYTPAQASYFCLENQTCSTDAINLSRRGKQDLAHILEVQPGEERAGYILYGIEHIQR